MRFLYFLGFIVSLLVGLFAAWIYSVAWFYSFEPSKLHLATQVALVSMGTIILSVVGAALFLWKFVKRC